MEALTIKTFKTSKVAAVDVKENCSKDYKGGWELQSF